MLVTLSGIAIGRVWDGHRAASTAVSGDSDRAVIGREIELGLHHGGERRQQQQRQQHFQTHFHNTF
jgi:hypothetical protein